MWNGTLSHSLPCFDPSRRWIIHPAGQVPHHHSLSQQNSGLCTLLATLFQGLHCYKQQLSRTSLYVYLCTHIQLYLEHKVPRNGIARPKPCAFILSLFETESNYVTQVGPELIVLPLSVNDSKN